MDRQDWVLLTVAAANGEAVSPVQLQKSVFLLGDRLTDAQRRTKGFYDFKPYDYGPFDANVYADASELASRGLIAADKPGDRNYRTYHLTPSGLTEAERMRKHIAGETAEFLDQVVDWVRSQSFRDLVQTIYRLYPDMKVNSVFRG